MLITEHQWTTLLRQIERQRSVLLLGPNAFFGGEKKSPLESFTVRIVSELEKSGTPYDRSEKHNFSYISQRFLKIPGNQRLDLEDFAKDYFTKYSKQNQSRIYEVLAKMPFDFIINTLPVNLIGSHLISGDKTNYQSLHYNFVRPTDVQVRDFSPRNPLVYHLFGEIKDEESILFTEKDRKDFIRAVITANPPIPKRITNELERRGSYIFLGFDFKEWHLRLLLDALKLEERNISLSLTNHNSLDSITRSYYEDIYDLTFVDESDCQSFVFELYTKYVRSQNVKINREVPEDIAPVPVIIINDQADDQIKDELKSFVEFLNRGRQTFVRVWDTSMTVAGMDPLHVMDELISNSTIVLPILSSDFFNNDWIQEECWPFLHNTIRDIKIYPILARSCPYQHTIFADLPILPSSKQPIAHWERRDDVYTEIIEFLSEKLAL